jgi:5'-nucleotidase
MGEVLVIAPTHPHSYCGHRVTTDRELTLTHTGQDQYHLDGTPADCVRVGLRSLFRDVDWVFSGVNRGGNLGADLFTSGTVAAAREAALLGVRSVAISQYLRREVKLNWQETGANAQKILESLVAVPSATSSFWNINLPHLPPDDPQPAEIVFCEPDIQPLDVRYQRHGDRFVYSGSYQTRPRTPGRDIDHCFAGRITVSKLTI